MSVASVVLRIDIGGGSPATMEHGKLSDRVERLATGLMNEHALLCDRPHHIVLDEFPHETAGTPLVDVRRRDPGRIAVLCNESRDDLSLANNRVYEILQEHDHVIKNPTEQGRKRPWVRFEREYAAVTVYMDWYHNDRGQQVLAVEDDASRRVFDMIEDDRPCLDHEFERYLHDNDIEHTLCKVGRPQSNGKIERFFRTHEKHRERFGTLGEFLTFYNEERPHMSLD